jgi:hypothetical protein
MMLPIVKQMAALAKAFQVADPVVPGIVIQVCRSEYDTRVPYLHCLNDIGPRCCSPVIIAPGVSVGIEPAAVG